LSADRADDTIVAGGVEGEKNNIVAEGTGPAGTSEDGSRQVDGRVGAGAYRGGQEPGRGKEYYQ